MSHVRYEPGPAFEENIEKAMLDIASTESKELWLIQWPRYQAIFSAQQPDATVFLPSGSEAKAGYSKKTKSRFTGASKNHRSQGSALSLCQQSAEPTQKHKQKRKDESSLGHSNVSGKSAEGSQSRSGDSNTTSEMPQTPVDKSKKKKNKKVRIAE
uniref:Uncharacterized protein n=1 Tax=Leersia perrieri TaxID=77586 RepID=A0A0D9VED0_9ORYZ